MIYIYLFIQIYQEWREKSRMMKINIYSIFFFASERELITTLVQFSEMLDVINQLTNYNTNADNYDDY